MDPAAQPTSPQGPPPGVTLGDPVAAAPPQGVTLGDPVTAPAHSSGPAAVNGHDLTTKADPNEGLYQMTGNGSALQVPFSKVQTALNLGYALPGEGNALRGDAYGSGELGRYWHDKLFQSPGQRLMGLPGEFAGVPAVHGAIKSALQVPNTVTGWLDNIAHTHAQPALKAGEEAVLPGSTQAPQGAGENLGSIAETLAEWTYGEGEAKAGIKAATTAEKLAKVGQMAKWLESHPKVAMLVKNGLLGAGQGAQALAHGATPGEAAAGAGVGAGVGLLGEAGAGAAERFINGRRVVPVTIAGETVHVPVAPKPTPNQAAGQRALETTRGSVLARNLAEVNEGRSVPENAPGLPAKTGPYTFEIQGLPTTETATSTIAHEPQQLPRQNITAPAEPSAANAEELGTTAAALPPRVTAPTTFMTGSAAGQEAAGEAVGGGGTLKTQNPDIARMHLEQLTDVMESPDFAKMPEAQQEQIRTARADTQRQLGEYHQQVVNNIPWKDAAHFDQIDIPRVAQQVGSWGEVGDQVERAAKDVYGRLDELSGNRFNALRNAEKDAWKSYLSASGTEEQTAAAQELGKAQGNIRQMFEDIAHAVSPKELAGANEAYRSAQVLNAFGRAVDGSFTGNAARSARSWGYRGFSGDMLASRVQRVVQQLGQARVERVIGRDNLQAVLDIAEANRSNTSRARFGAATDQVGQWLAEHGGLHFAPRAAAMGLGAMAGNSAGINGWLGASAGEAAYEGSRVMLQKILTNPKAAQNLLYAVRTGAKPETYVPIVGAILQQADQQNQQKEGQQ